MASHQYDNPIKCYSEDTLKEMSETGTWKKTEQSVKGIKADPTKFSPQNSAVLAALFDAEKGIHFSL